MACKNRRRSSGDGLERALDDPGTSGNGASSQGQKDRLDSWKKIASYLKRDTSTVQRWERREAMPVHRHLHDKLGSVFAYRSEIDQWWAGRAARLTHEPIVGRESAAKSIANDVAGSTVPTSPAPAGGG